MNQRVVGVFGEAGPASGEDSEHWLTISDLMAGLMMVFLFISIALMQSAFVERDKIREIAVAYKDTQIAINAALADEFREDLPEWQAEIDPETLSFEFRSPEVLFEVGQIDLRRRFQEILADFFPRYLTILEGFTDSIEEVRIEGHTSSDWTAATGEDAAYFLNMWLSQGRTRAVLDYVYRLESIATRRGWVKRNIAAVGFSSSRLVLGESGQEDPEASRRVAFRVITNADTQIRKILDD